MDKELLKKQPKVQKVYPKFVELIWESGSNPALKDFERVEHLEEITGSEFEKWKEHLRVTKSRYGAKARPYDICVYRIWNKDRTKVIA